MKILMVDDNKGQLGNMEEILGDILGHEVVLAETLADGLSKLVSENELGGNN